GVVVWVAVGVFLRVVGRVGRAENRSSPGPMSGGGLAGDPAEHDEDPRISGRNRGRGRAASPGSSAAAEGRQRAGAEGEGGGGSGRVADAERDRGSLASGSRRP